MKLSDKLNSLNKYPFHMPGHKRNEKFNIIGSNIDITEIDGYDNLHQPQSIILDIENRLTKHYSSKKSFMLVNGSTVGILSAIFAVCNEGDKVIIARNCHKSVYNACMLRKLKIAYIEPEFDSENGYYTHILQSTIDEATSINSDAKCIVITSPTYEGNISNIVSTIPIIIDSAHGAHLGLSSFPAYPKGDIVISSLHKTLPALTQSAVANVYNEKYISKVKFYLDIFETSSPSYIIMNSVDKCLDYIEQNKNEFDKYYNLANSFHNYKLNKFKIKAVDDASKIVISTANTTISGTQLAQILRDSFNIEVEMASTNYIILMTSIGDEEEAFNNLYFALKSIENESFGVEKATSKSIAKPLCPNDIQVINTDDKSVELELSNAIGKKANEFVFAYPPDIPLIVPNETITASTVDYIIKMQGAGVNIISDSGLLPNKILTKDQV